MDATLMIMSDLFDPICDWLYRPAKNQHKKARTTPMEILSCGPSRSGTGTVNQALIDLGYKLPYHGIDNVLDPHYGWVKAAKAKYQGGEPMTTEDWDDILGDRSAVSDLFPAANAEELMDTYPDAKVILSVRDTDQWVKSYYNNVARSVNGYDCFFRSFQRDMWILRYASVSIHNHWFRGDYKLNAARFYREHNAMIRGMAEKRGMPFLEFDVKEGWEPLCRFLDKPVPDHPFPHENASAILMPKLLKASGPRLQRARQRFYVFLTMLGALSAVAAWGAWTRFPRITIG